MRSFLLLALLVAPITTTVAYDWTCNLFCYNEGDCKHGKGKFGSFAGMTEDDNPLPFEEQKHVSGMYCSCPVGYTGLQCEIKFVVCGEDGIDTHTCFNGSDCTKERVDSGEVYYRCECDAAKSVLDASYAGKFCEHASTIFCDKNTDGSFGAGNSFCVNGGRCKDKTTTDQTHVGCECSDSWEGPHCEYPKGTFYDVEDPAVDLYDPKTLGLGVGLAAVFLFCGLLGFLYYRHRRAASSSKQQQRKKQQQQQARRVAHGEII